MFDFGGPKTLLRLCGLCVLLALLWHLSGKAAPQNSVETASASQNPTEITVEALQLAASDGVIPVELRCENARLPTPNEIDDRHCVIRNNTKPPINAVTLGVSVSVEQFGRILPDTGYLTTDAHIHPDLHAERTSYLLLPGRETTIRDIQTTFSEGAVVKGMTVWIDYVEFEDQTPLGPNRVGSRVVAETRSGAEKYKKWLTQKFKERGKSKDSVAYILEMEPSTEELGLGDGYEEQGVHFYQDFARKIHKTKGAEGVVKLLESTDPHIHR